MPDGERPVFVGVASEVRGNEVLARDACHRDQDPLVMHFVAESLDEVLASGYVVDSHGPLDVPWNIGAIPLLP
jgi:hypothetical protein